MSTVSLTRRAAVGPQIVLAVASLGVFMAFVDATIVNIAFPSIERSFPHASLSGLSWVLNAYNIVFAALMVGAGRIADVIGRRKVFRAGVMLFTVASGACAAAPSPSLLVLARVVQAVGAAVLVPCSLALVLQAFPEQRRTHAVAMWTATAALAAGVGPPLGGALVSAVNWRLAFVVNLPIGAAAFVLAGRTLVESRVPGRRRLPDVAGAVVLAGALGALTLAIVKGSGWGWSSWRTVAALAVAAALLATFVQRCRTQRVPVIDLNLIRIRNVAVGNSLMVLCATGFFAYTLCNVLFLTSVWHYSILHAGLAITPGPFIAVAVARPVSELADRVGHRVVVMAGALLWAAGLVWFIARVGTHPDFLSHWLPGMVLLGLGAGIAFPNVSSVAVASAPGERFATATAINSVARQLGAVLGVAVLVAIIGTPAGGGALHAFRGGWWLGVGCFAAMAVGALAIGRIELPRPPASAAPATTRGTALSSSLQANGAPPVRRPGVRSSGTPAEFLRAVPLFAEMEDAVIDRIVDGAARVRLPAGEWLFREGDVGDCLYVVRSGRLEAVRDDASVATIERGSVVGELAVLASSRRAASIRALRNCELLRVTSDDFTALMARSPALAAALARTLSAQLQSGLGPAIARRPVPSTIALVPLEDGLPMTDVRRALEEGLARHGSVETVCDDDPRTAIDDPLAEFGPLVDRCEASNDHVLMPAERPDRDDAWTAFALARADRILAVTGGGPVPEWLPESVTLRGAELVGYGIRPGSGALSEWIEALSPDAVHRLDAGDRLSQSAALAARRLAGRSLGIVLSGGGARAFAHLGVLEELLAAGLQIDRVGGVSMGAFIGGQLAAGRGLDEIDAHCYDEWVRRNPINDYTLPRKALLRGQKAVAMVDRVFGELAIEELPRPFYCASTDLRSSELVIHRHGPLAALVLASISLPILAPPRAHDGRALIDGSLLDNLPVEPMAAAGEGPVIAVDVKPRASTGGGGKRRRSSVPALGETIARVLQLATSDTTESAGRHADFVIRAQVEGVGLLEFHQIDAAREAGRRAARAALEADLLASEAG